MVSFGDGVELYAWEIATDVEPHRYVVVATTAREAEACFRVGWSEKRGGTATPPEVTEIRMVGKYLWPR